MRRLLALAALALFAFPQLAQAGTWRYRFEPGKQYRYRATSTSKMSVQVPMMGAIEDRIDLDTTYRLTVDRRLPDGRYDLRIDVERLVLSPASGQPITLADIPAAFRTVRAYLTPRGRFQFYERVVVQVEQTEGGGSHYALGVIKADGKVAAGAVTASDGEEEVTAYASIDPKTGKVSAGITRKKAAPAKKRTRTVERTEERPVQNLDLLPVDVLALMELPAGPVAPGMKATVSTPMLDLVTTAEAPAPCGEATCGRLRIVSRADVDADSTRKTAASAQAMGGMPAMGGDDMDMDMDMDMDTGDDGAEAGAGGMGMGGMPGMGGGMPGMGGGMPGMGGDDPGAGMAATGTAMKLDVDATLYFDEAAGNLDHLEGTTRSKVDHMGMKMSDDTRFTLRRL